MTYQHSGAAQHPLPPQSVATTILKRHTNHQRQRFDSADHALCKQLQAAAAVVSPQRSGSHAAASCDAQEPEPEADHSALKPPSRVEANTSSSNSACTSTSTSVHEYPQQHVRRIRLQRFDSADWVMDAQLSRTDSQSASTAQSTVAKLILDRHAYTTCHFMTTPVEQQRCAEKA
uniref:Uncharacterized protein n=1 Tax=Globisporangium ultimum (strain ATCC 200006 / CBS 805.95 / DAOM BR144) TaxID=431595 RepID=K3W6T2_GLOUD